MRYYELGPISDGLSGCDRALWEQTRLKIYSTASMFSKNKIDIKDIMTFPWEQTEEEPVTEMTNTDKERLSKRAEMIARTLK